MRVLGIDTSLRSTGVGIVEADGSRLSAVEAGVLRSPTKATLSACLTNLQEGLQELIERTHPEAVAIEGVFYCKNVKTALLLGQAWRALEHWLGRPAPIDVMRDALTQELETPDD